MRLRNIPGANEAVAAAHIVYRMQQNTVDNGMPFLKMTIRSISKSAWEKADF